MNCENKVDERGFNEWGPGMFSKTSHILAYKIIPIGTCIIYVCVCACVCGNYKN